MKKIFTLVFCSTISFGFAQNDPCTAVDLAPLFGATSAACSGGGSAATTITPGTVNLWSTNTGGITGLVTTCVLGTVVAASQDYWYSFTAPAGMGSTSLDMSGAGGGLDNVESQVYSGSGTCPTVAMTLVGCGVSVTWTPIAGVTYYVRVYGEAANIPAMDKFTICARTSPVNDLCTNAVTLTSGVSVCGNTYGASQNAPATTGGCTTDQYVWYKFTTGATVGCYSFNGTNIVAPTCATNAFLLYSGCSAAGGAAGTLNGFNLSNNAFNDFSTADLTTAMTANTTYYLAMGTDYNATFCLNYNANVTAAANDQCSGALAIGSTAVATDNASAGCEYTYVPAQDANITPASVCAGTLENVSWFTFTTLATGAVSISFANILCNNGGGGFQTGLFTGSSCAALTMGTSGTAICVAAASGTVTYSIASSTAGTTYYIGMDGNAGSNCHFNVSGTNVVPLPIDLISFQTKSIGNSKVMAEWKTASETNNDYFTVERTKDGIHFEDVCIVKGSGNSTSTKDYSSIDPHPFKGISYYRLKQTDFNGETSYSAISAVSIDDESELNFSIYPNPTQMDDSQYLQFAGNANEIIAIEIYDVTGKVISDKRIMLDSSGNASIELKHHFSQGMYFVKATTPGGKSINQKLIVK